MSKNLLAAVVDKNVIRGSSLASLAALREKYYLIAPNELFYEMFTDTDPDVAKNIWRKFSADECPCARVFMGGLLKYEITEKIPVPIPDMVESGFVLNAGLAAGTYEYPDEVTEALRRWESEVETFQSWAMEVSRMSHLWFPSLSAPSFKDALSEVARISAGVAKDDPEFAFIYTEILASGDYPAATDPRWHIYRWIKLNFLASLLWVERFGRGGPEGADLFNDVVDRQYVLLAASVGAFLSHEHKSRYLFRLMRPDGDLFPERVPGDDSFMKKLDAVYAS